MLGKWNVGMLECWNVGMHDLQNPRRARPAGFMTGQLPLTTIPNATHLSRADVSYVSYRTHVGITSHGIAGQRLRMQVVIVHGRVGRHQSTVGRYLPGRAPFFLQPLPGACPSWVQVRVKCPQCEADSD